MISFQEAGLTAEPKLKQTLRGSVAKNILTTFYSGNRFANTTISCEVTEFLQQSL
jgi:hypothetical protein